MAAAFRLRSLGPIGSRSNALLAEVPAPRPFVRDVPELSTERAVREGPGLGSRWAGPSVLTGSWPALGSLPRPGSGSAPGMSALFTWRPLFRVRARSPDQDASFAQNSRPRTGKW